ncbi:cytadherence-associated protein [Mycoplasma sp. E35C]|uniref:cytadherence-associated protein n=1 Tax=Mycoplasma sp. E35C TaxID=2801918 RepID=UPI001CA434FC|nr:cytadherence-associated protein [Mycoplasma sp. E35C]QZX49420.1 cytadherence-associated protein [Mycoplasma sp. E35C]
MNNKEYLNALIKEEELKLKKEQEEFISKYDMPQVNYSINYQEEYTKEQEQEDDALIALLTEQLEALKKQLLEDDEIKQDDQEVYQPTMVVVEKQTNDQSVIINQEYLSSQILFLSNLYTNFFNKYQQASIFNLDDLINVSDKNELKKHYYSLNKSFVQTKLIFEEISKYSQIVFDEINKQPNAKFDLVFNNQTFKSLNELSVHLFELKLDAKTKVASLEQNINLLNSELANFDNLTKEDLQEIRKEIQPTNSLTKQDLALLKQELLADINTDTKKDLESLKQSVLKTQLELIELNEQKLNELKQEHQTQIELAKNSQQFIVDQLVLTIQQQEKLLDEKLAYLNELRPINITETTVEASPIITVKPEELTQQLQAQQASDHNINLRTKLDQFNVQNQVVTPQIHQQTQPLIQPVQTNPIPVNPTFNQQPTQLINPTINQPIQPQELIQPNVVVVNETKLDNEEVLVSKNINELNPLTQTRFELNEVKPELINQEVVNTQVNVNPASPEINDLNALVKNIQVENIKLDQIKKQIQEEKIKLSEVDSSYLINEDVIVNVSNNQINNKTNNPQFNIDEQVLINHQINAQPSVINSVNHYINNNQLHAQLLNSIPSNNQMVDEFKIIEDKLTQSDKTTGLLSNFKIDTLSKLDQLKLKYQEDQKLLEQKQEQSQLQIQALNAQINQLKEQLVKNQEINQTEIIKKTSEFKDVLQNQKQAYETILNEHKERYENELIKSKNDFIKLINEKIQNKTNELIDQKQDDLSQIRDTYLSVLSEQQKEYDQEIKKKQSEIISKLNKQKEQFDDIIRLKNLEWNQYQEHIINKNNKALDELQKQKQAYETDLSNNKSQTKSQADDLNSIEQKILKLKAEQQKTQSIIDQYNSSKDQILHSFEDIYNKENINQITNEITNKISQTFNQEISRLKENTYNYYPEAIDYYGYYDQYNEAYVDENGMYFEPVDVELDPKLVDQFNEYNQSGYDLNYDHNDQVVDYNNNDYDDYSYDADGIRHYNTKDIVIINDKIQEHLDNDQSLKIRKPGGWFARKIYEAKTGEKEKIPQKMSGRRGVFKSVNKGRLSKDEIKQYANKIINSNK